MGYVLFGTSLYTDGNRICNGLEYIRDHGTVKYSVGRYVDEWIHLSGMESFWVALKRDIIGMYHDPSKKHLQRYANQFCTKHNFRDSDGALMEHIAALAVGKRLMYRDLINQKLSLRV